MRYLCIILDRYERIKLANVTRLEWRPEASYQTILGTNGCGKSSLMAELSPLPPTPGDFGKGGSKHIELEHKGSQYILHSDINTTVRHSFIKDGLELNDGGTGAIQIELVRQHLGYFKDLHPVLAGQKGSRFTEMSQAERRKWITLMSRADHTYALAVHKRLTDAARDLEGHLKHTKKRLHDESVALSQLAESEGIEDRVRLLQADLTDLIYARQPTNVSLPHALQQLSRSRDELDRVNEATLVTAKRIDLHGTIRGSDACDSFIARKRLEEVSLKTTVERYQHEYADVETMLRTFEDVEVADVPELEARLTRAYSDQEAMKGMVTQFPSLLSCSDTRALAATSEEVLPAVMDLFGLLPDNSDRRFNRERLTTSTEERRKLQDSVDHAEQMLKTLRNRLHVIEHAAPETCPQCAHRFILGEKPGERVEIQASIVNYGKHMEQATARMAELTTYLEQADEYMGYYRRWRGFVSQYPRLEALWMYLVNTQCDIITPGEHQDVFARWNEEVAAVVLYQQYREEADQLTRKITHAKIGGQAQLTQRLAKIEAELVTATAALKEVQNELRYQELQGNLFKQLDARVEEWNAALLSLEERYDQAMVSLAHQYVEDEIVRTQSQLGALQHTLNAKTVLMTLIEDLQKTLDEALLDHEAITLLAKELSPKEGFIAEQITGFIRCFTEQLNSIIASVWSYELVILPCGMENGSLDYKFPMECGADGPSPSDVSRGSTSQQDIVDFAFRLTVMLYLGLEEYPLLVDELGASFDEAHRTAVNHFLARLMDSQQYSQVFMISHYVAGWGAFTDAEYLVLDSRNIAVPSPHNTHVTLS